LSSRGIDAVGEFARLIGVSPSSIDVTAATAGTVLRRLFLEHRDRLAELASVVYRRLTEHNRVKTVCLVASDADVSAASRSIAVRLMDQLFTQDGKFDTGDAIDINQKEIERTKERARAVMIERGSERLVANAALQHANERASFVTFVVEQSALVRADFQIDRPRDARPVFAYFYHDGKLYVQVDNTLRLLRSRAYLGGGRVRASSVDRSLSVGASVLRRAADRRLEELRVQAAVVRARVDVFTEATAGDGDPNSLRELQTFRNKLVDLENEEQRLGSELEEISEVQSRVGEQRFEPFYFFCSVEVTIRVFSDVVSASTTDADVRRACRDLLNWYAKSPLKTSAATLDDVLQYGRQLVIFDANVRRLVRGKSRFDPNDEENNSLAAFVYAASTALAAPLADASVLSLPVHPTSLANNVTQPFSELSALEGAEEDDRVALRNALFDVWYELATQLRWERSGYFNAPFNSTRMLWLPAITSASYDTHETAHVALSLALRRLRGADFDRSELNAYLDADEGDSDSDQDEAGDEESGTNDENPHVTQLRTLRSALETETTLLQAARTLWFDANIVCAAGAEFARMCKEALNDLYAALVNDRPLAATNLLASTLDNEKAPLAVDPRAQALIADYWRAYGAADAEVLRRDAVAKFYDEHSAEDADSFYAVVDAVQDRVLASNSSVSAARRVTTATELQRRHDEQVARVKRAQADLLGAIRKRDGAISKLERIGREDAVAAAELSALLRSQSQDNRDEIATKIAEARAKLAEIDVRRGEVSLELLASYSDEGALSERVARRKELDALIDERLKEIDTIERNNSTLGQLRTRLRVAQSRLRELRQTPVRSDYSDQLSDLRSRTDTLRRQMLTASKSDAPALLAQLERDEARLLALTATTEQAARQRVALDEHIEQLRNALANDTDRSALQVQVEAAQAEIATIENDKRLRADAAAKQRERRREIAEFNDTIAELQTKVANEERKMRESNGRLSIVFDSLNVLAAQRRAILYYDEIAQRIDRARRVINELDKTEDDERAKERPDPKLLAALRRQRASAKRSLNLLLSPQELRAEEETPIEVVMSAGENRDLERLINEQEQWTPTLRVERDQRVASGLYDAPLANLKPATAEAVAIATAMMESQKLDDDTTTLLENESDDAVLACYNVVRPIFKSGAAKSTGTQATLDKITAHINVTLQAAVQRRLNARLAALVASGRVVGADEKSKLRDARQATLSALTTPKSDRTLGSRTLSLAELAALRQCYRSYGARLRARRTLNLINALGTTFGGGGNGGEISPIPRLIAILLVPAAIERAKLQLQLDFENGRLPIHMPQSPYAIANAADAPQALRIDEIVARFCVYHEMPFAPSSLYQGYAAVRRRQPTLERVAYMRERTAALTRLDGEQQLYSVGNGVHRAMPSATDTFLSALVVELMRIYAALHDFESLDDLYVQTQTIDAATQTRAIAALPSARQRLWLHLACLFGQRLQTIPGTKFECMLPVWREMRAVDIRLLALVVLGFDVAPRLDSDGESVRMSQQYLHLRSQAAKYLLVDAYYSALIDKFFREHAPAAIAADADEGEFENALMLTYRRVVSLEDDVQALERVSRVRRVVRIGTAAQPSSQSGMRLATAANEQQVRAAYDRHLRADWTRNTTTTPVSRLSTDYAGSLVDLVRDAARPYDGFLALFCNTALDNAVLYEQVTAAFADREQIVRHEPVDFRWLAVPRAALVGILVRRSLAVAVVPSAEQLYARHAPRYNWERDNTLDVIERIVSLVEDSAHLLADDTPDTAVDLVQHLVEPPLVPQPRALATQAPVIGTPQSAPVKETTTAPTTMATTATTTTAPTTFATKAVVQPNTDIDGWRTKVELQLAKLLDAKTCELRGVELTEPFATTDKPFATLPVGVQLLRYESIVGTGIDDVQDALENYIAPVIDEARRLFATTMSTGTPTTPERADDWDAPIEAQRQLLKLLIHTENARRRRWQLSGGQFADPTPKSLVETQKLAGWFQPWHVLFYASLAATFPTTGQKPKDILECVVGESAAIQDLLRVELGRRSVQPLALEQLVPVYDLLRCMFSRAPKTGSERVPNLLDQRHPFWQLLMAPRLRKFIVRVQTVDDRDEIGSSYVRLAYAGDIPCALFATSYLLAYDRQELARSLEARTLASDDVLVTHEHRFTTTGAVKRGQRSAATYVTLTRVRAETNVSLKRSLDVAQGAGIGVPIVGVPIPVVTYESLPPK
jgi:hypothetical protein